MRRPRISRAGPTDLSRSRQARERERICIPEELERLAVAMSDAHLPPTMRVFAMRIYDRAGAAHAMATVNGWRGGDDAL